ncbi:DUF1203 domain-containing protein [Aquimarina sp. 2201CG5-10]|uniref:DUF1203 domain-containing protein n=1 Tax=Aquimarina callyspongiae TaxID=3098150 RepID=UPI002AB36177|nr:DUF1203 domain-containing protein [Aquimarina sp. 2201CG5-10]MDY8137798.1 DUF1203 domain-containing protein [Aquimarina sp. 2201CG5-10]
MNRFKIVPLTKAFATDIRSRKLDDFNNKIVEQIATSYGPCRVSLKPFIPGKDKRLLLSHSPFEKNNAFNQPGPIFIHKEEVTPYQDIYKFPEEIKADKKNFPLSLIGYNKNQKMIFTQLVGNNDVDVLIPHIFEKHSEIAYLHARNAEACCFICKIERA